MFSYRQSAGGAEEEEDDWRAINTLRVDMCVFVRECVDLHDACLRVACLGRTYCCESLDAVRRVLGL